MSKLSRLVLDQNLSMRSPTRSGVRDEECGGRARLSRRPLGRPGSSFCVATKRFLESKASSFSASLGNTAPSGRPGDPAGNKSAAAEQQSDSSRLDTTSYSSLQLAHGLHYVSALASTHAPSVAASRRLVVLLISSPRPVAPDTDPSDSAQARRPDLRRHRCRLASSGDLDRRGACRCREAGRSVGRRGEEGGQAQDHRAQRVRQSLAAHAVRRRGLR